MPKIVDHEEQRRQLSATVAAVVSELGLENTTLRSVAAHHGCTKGMVQHYFADKEELLLGALVYVEDCCAQRMLQPSQTRAGLDLLQSRLYAQLPLKPKIIREWQVRLAFSTRAAISVDMRQALSESRSRHERMGVNCLRAAQKSGELKPNIQVRNRYRSLAALVFGLGAGAVMNPEQMPPAAQRKMLKTAIDDLRC